MPRPTENANNTAIDCGLEGRRHSTLTMSARMHDRAHDYFFIKGLIANSVRTVACEHAIKFRLGPDPDAL